MNIIFIYILLLSLFKIDNKELKGIFDYCEYNINDAPYILNSDCVKKVLNKNSKEEKYTLLEKTKYHIYGEGYKCNIDKIEVATYKQFFGYKDQWRAVYPEKVTYTECFNMVKEKKCRNNDLIGEERHLKSILEPEIDYFWLRTTHYFSHHCNIFKVPITGYDLKKKLFSKAQSSCIANDLFCIIDYDTYIWSKNILNDCEFLKIKDMNMTLQGSLLIGENLLFKIIKKEINCGIEMFVTTEGIYITKFDKNMVWHNSILNIDLEHEIMLADFDNKNFNMIKILSNYISNMNFRECNNWNILIDLFRKNHNGYLKLRYDDKIDIIFNYFGKFLKCICKSISRIKLREVEICYEDIPISFILNNKEENGFLLNDGIITKNSKKTDCRDENYVEIFNGFNYFTIYKKGRNLKILNASLNKLNLKEFELNLNDMNFVHDLNFEANFDLIKETKWVFDNNDNDLVNVENDHFIDNQQSALEFFTNIYNYFDSYKYFLLVVLIIIVIVLFFIIVFKCKFYKNLTCSKKRRTIKNRNKPIKKTSGNIIEKRSKEELEVLNMENLNLHIPLTNEKYIEVIPQVDIKNDVIISDDLKNKRMMEKLDKLFKKTEERLKREKLNNLV